MGRSAPIAATARWGVKPVPKTYREYPDQMTLTGRTDQHKGREYKCTDCGAYRWSAWGNAWRHPQFCPESGRA